MTGFKPFGQNLIERSVFYHHHHRISSIESTIKMLGKNIMRESEQKLVSFSHTKCAQIGGEFSFNFCY